MIGLKTVKNAIKQTGNHSGSVRTYYSIEHQLEIK